MKIEFLIIVLGLCVLSFDNLYAMEQDTTIRYYIDHVEVTAQNFNEKLAKMKETGGWYCYDMNNGGITGYDCEDEFGQAYHYECVANSEMGNKYSLTKIRPYKTDKHDNQ